MIVYAMAKGIRLGVLNAGWYETLDLAQQGLISEFVLETKEEWVNLNKNCQVAGLGGVDQRDGTFAYYISEPIVTNDQKVWVLSFSMCGIRTIKRLDLIQNREAYEC